MIKSVPIYDIDDSSMVVNTDDFWWWSWWWAVNSVNWKTWTVILNKSDIWLSNVDNTSDLNKPIATATQTALNNKANLVAGKVPSNELPSYVDDVLEFPNLASFPVTWESWKIYIALDNWISYRWTGSIYTAVTDLSNYYTKVENDNLLNWKVDKVVWKQLSTEDYTTAEKTKLSWIQALATANSTDTQLRDRATHTWVQDISTITNLQTTLDWKANLSSIWKYRAYLSWWNDHNTLVIRPDSENFMIEIDSGDILKYNSSISWVLVGNRLIVNYWE